MISATSSSVRAFLNTASQTIDRHGMLRSGDTVLMAVSGGPDSVALAQMLVMIARDRGLRLGIAHFNHGLRGAEARKDAEFVRNLAEEQHLPFHLGGGNVALFAKRRRLSIEEAGRRRRYAFLENIAQQNGYRRIALGHHADDNAEWLLMDLIRGTGRLGLAGIPPIRGGRMIRPLIDLFRRDILRFLSETNRAYRIDATNADCRYLRNRVRHDLIPRLQRDNPRIVQSLNRLAMICRDEEEWLGEIIRSRLNDRAIRRSPARIDLSRAELSGLHRAEMRRLIREAVQSVKGDLRRISFSQIESACRLIRSDRIDGQIHLPGRIRLQATATAVILSREEKPLREEAIQSGAPHPPTFHVIIPEPGRYAIPQIGITITFHPLPPSANPDLTEAGQLVAFFDMDQIDFPLVVRNLLPGDRFTPLGMTGSQKVSTFFINKKVPRDKRAGCPLVLCRDRIIWVAGHQIDNGVRVTPETSRIIRAAISVA